MKKILFVLALILLLSCDKKNNLPRPKNTPNTQIENADISGVWTLLSRDDYFISFTEGGKYSFCFNNHLMGSGIFSLKDNVISLSNAYTNKTDKISIELSQNMLKIKGDIYKFDSNSNDTESFSGEFIKTTEFASPSLIGVKKKPNLYGFGPNQKTIYSAVEFLTDFFAKHTKIVEYKNTGKQITYTHSWYYVYRTPTLYTQKLDGDGYIVLYNTEKGQWPGIYNNGQEL